MRRSLSFLLPLMLVVCGCDSGAGATPAGRLIDLGPADLGSSAPTGEVATHAAHCQVGVAGTEETSFTFDVESTSYETDQGPRLVGFRVSVSESECGLDAQSMGAPRFLEVGGVPRSEVSVTVHYRCPGIVGSGVITASTANPPRVVMTGARCEEG